MPQIVSPWRRHAQKVIGQALDEAKALGLTDRQAIEKHVSAAYPFGERRMYPYRIWLHEFDLMVRKINRPFERRGPSKRKLNELAKSFPMPEQAKLAFLVDD